MASSFKPNARLLAFLTALVIIITSIAVPLRAFVNEKRDIAMLKEQIAQKQKNVAQLKADAKKLENRAYLQSLARSRLNYVFPGEIGLVVIDKGTSTAIDTVPGALVPNDTSAWYSKLWRSAELADKPGARSGSLVIQDKPEKK
ncbi:MAG: septum formation initiator family protein [Actinomycetales bacterium]|nr:septum formation initiator family protein [Actinomycetales bacterium]